MRRLVPVLALALAAGCARPAPRIAGTPGGSLPVVAVGQVDATPKADLRMVPPEAYMRTYLELFGELAPLDVQKKARGNDGANLFDTWNDYVSALGFPDYALDIPRQVQTNALMVATFERLGVALCDRAIEHDLPYLGKTPPKADAAKPAEAKPPPATKPAEATKPTATAKPADGAPKPGKVEAPKPAPPPPPVVLPIAQRTVFAFDAPVGALTEPAFAERFDVLHRTFLGYPARLAPPDRVARFHALYTDIATHHAKESPKSRFSPEQAGWASVCYGLVRHPEFHLY